ncbi:hypothetical protein [Phormidesmis sp. 146-33]
MSNASSGWWLLVAIAGVSGVFNLIVAAEKFNRRFRSPFFTPWLSLGLWWWVLLQLVLPSIVFWLLFGASIQPPIASDKFPDLVTKAITVGLGFNAFVNANIDLGFTGVPFSEFYFLLTRLAFRQIEASQRGRLTDFKSELRQELSQTSNQFESGLAWLRDYFEGDSSLRTEEERNFLTRIEAARTMTPQIEQIGAIVRLLLDVRSKDCLSALKQFGCSDSFLQKYFPKKFAKSKAPKP